MAKDLSAQLCSRPAPQNSHDMKCSFRNSGLLSNGSAFVDSIGNESDDAPCNGRQKIDRQCGRKSYPVACEGEIKQIRSRGKPEDRKEGEPPLKAVKWIQPFQPGSSARHDAGLCEFEFLKPQVIAYRTAESMSGLGTEHVELQTFSHISATVNTAAVGIVRRCRRRLDEEPQKP